jgi:hypothetical protein
LKGRNNGANGVNDARSKHSVLRWICIGQDHCAEGHRYLDVALKSLLLDKLDHSVEGIEEVRHSNATVVAVEGLVTHCHLASVLANSFSLFLTKRSNELECVLKPRLVVKARRN